MIKLPHWTIICVALGAFLLPVTGGHFSIESGQIDASDNVLKAVLDGESACMYRCFDRRQQFPCGDDPHDP